MTDDECEQALSTLKADHRLRRLSLIDSATATTVVQDGRRFLNFSSNNYLGLAHHPALKRAAAAAIRRFGVGAGASRLLSGNHRLYEALEAAIARFKSAPAALVFNSGYVANLGALGAWIQPGDFVFCDRLSHASLIEGVRGSAGTLRVYRHGDVDHLRALLAGRRGGRRALIVTDGVFSMDGDIAPLPALVALAIEYDAQVYLDDAHATGVLGSRGAGTCDHFNLHDPRIIQMGTFSKALGGLGGFVATGVSQIQYLVNQSGALIYTTALPPATLASAIAALSWIEENPTPRQRLLRHATYLRARVAAAGFNIGEGCTPILPIRIGDNEKAVAFSLRLLEAGFWVPAIRQPTVPAGESRLRISLTAAHTRAQIDRLVDALSSVGRALRIL